MLQLTSRLSIAMAVLAAAACEDGVSPRPSTPVVAVYFGGEGIATIHEGDDLHRIEDLGTPYLGAHAASPRREWFAIALGPEETESEPWRLVGYDICSGIERFSVPFNQRVGGTLIRNAFALGVAPEGDRIFLWQAYRDLALEGGVELIPGIAVLDEQGDDVLGFLEGIEPRVYSYITFIPPGPAFPLGAAAVLGERTGGERKVYITSRDGFLLDSIGSETFGGLGLLSHVVPEASGRVILVAGSGRLARVDLLTREVLAVAPRPGTGDVVEVGDGTFLVGDVGVFPDFPGTGYLYRLGPDLEVLERIDVSTPVGGHPNGSTASRMLGVAVDRRLGLAWVSRGSSQFGLFPYQPPMIIVVDLETNTVVRTIDVGEFGTGTVGVVKPC